MSGGRRKPPADGYALATARRHWDGYAQRWQHVRPPLRPSEEDLRVMRAAVRAQQRRCGDGGLEALLLGITPEIAEMAWPEGATLLAVERSQEMIHAVWPGDIPGRRRARQGDWLALAEADDAFDLVIGDGCYSCVPYPGGYRELALALRRVLRVEGTLVMRFFVQPDEPETPEEVFRALARGRIGSFHVFKFRLVMALQPQPERGVRLGDVWQAWADSGIDPERLARDTGWPRAAVDTIETYRDQDTRLTFPRLGEALAALPGGFAREALSTPSYEMGDRCPTVVLRRVE